MFVCPLSLRLAIPYIIQTLVACPNSQFACELTYIYLTSCNCRIPKFKGKANGFRMPWAQLPNALV